MNRGLAWLNVVLVVIAGAWTVSCTVAAQVPAITIGAIAGLGAAVGVLAHDLLDQATGDIRSLLEQIERTVEELTTRLADTYRGLLDATIDQLDEAVRHALEQVYSTFQQLHADLQVSLANLTTQLLTTLREAVFGARATLAQAEEGAHRVVSEAIDGGVFIVALILFAAALLVAVRTIATGRMRRPGRGRTAVAVLLAFAVLAFGALLLAPGRRAVYRMAGLRALEPLRQPTIFEVRPATIVIGRTKEILILGARLAPDGTVPQLTIADVRVPVVGGNEALAADPQSVDLGGVTGSRAVQVQTSGPDPRTATALVRIDAKRALPRIVAWTITPIGARWESRGSTTRRNIGCEAPGRRIGETRSCNFSELVIVPQDQGYVLDVSKPAELGRGAGETVSNDGDARAGFREEITTYRPRHGSPRYPRREINYHPDASRPIGIRIAGSARNDVSTDPNGTRAEFRADYTVFARWRNPASAGQVWTFSGACDVSGTVTCGTYPYPQELGAFAGAVRYLVDVTLRGSDGALAHANASLTPGTGGLSVPLRYEAVDGTLATATYTVQMIGSSVQASGPQLGPIAAPVIGPRLGPALERLRVRTR